MAHAMFFERIQTKVPLTQEHMQPLRALLHNVYGPYESYPQQDLKCFEKVSSVWSSFHLLGIWQLEGTLSELTLELKKKCASGPTRTWAMIELKVSVQKVVRNEIMNDPGNEDMILKSFTEFLRLRPEEHFVSKPYEEKALQIMKANVAIQKRMQTYEEKMTIDEISDDIQAMKDIPETNDLFAYFTKENLAAAVPNLHSEVVERYVEELENTDPCDQKWVDATLREESLLTCSVERCAGLKLRHTLARGSLRRRSVLLNCPLKLPGPATAFDELQDEAQKALWQGKTTAAAKKIFMETGTKKAGDVSLPQEVRSGLMEAPTDSEIPLLKLEVDLVKVQSFIGNEPYEKGDLDVAIKGFKASRFLLTDRENPHLVALMKAMCKQLDEALDRIHKEVKTPAEATCVSDNCPLNGADGAGKALLTSDLTYPSVEGSTIDGPGGAGEAKTLVTSTASGSSVTASNNVLLASVSTDTPLSSATAATGFSVTSPNAADAEICTSGNCEYLDVPGGAGGAQTPVTSVPTGFSVTDSNTAVPGSKTEEWSFYEYLALVGIVLAVIFALSALVIHMQQPPPRRASSTYLGMRYSKMGRRTRNQVEEHKRDQERKQAILDGDGL